MNETTKSLIFVAVAAIAGIAAYIARPTAGEVDSAVPMEKELFESFKDPLLASSLEIVKPDDTSSTVQSFKVLQENGLWVIPSSSNYPADARDRIKNAATVLIGLDVIDIASDKKSEHELYGVIQPETGKTLTNLKGVGAMVTIKDSSGKELASLIVGKSPKGQPDQHFVRRPSQDRVYVTKINLDQISTKFEDWIDKDLLNINPLDVSAMELKSYSFKPMRDPSSGRTVLQLSPKADLNVIYDDKLSKWTPGDLWAYATQDQQSVKKEAPLSEQEELDSAKLDGLKTALDNLQIAGVRRKPAGFTADLKAEKSFAENGEAIESLRSKGFIPRAAASGEIDIIGTDGEINISCKDGVQYALRFGEIDQGEDGKVTTELNRFMLVSVKLNKDAIPPPVLEVEPAGPEAPKPTEPKEGEKKDDQQPPDDVAAEAKLAQERERVKKENERKTSEYNTKLNKANSRVSELNYRFADWYYLVSDETFKQLSLNRSDIVKEKPEAARDGFGVDAFRALQREGVNPPPPEPKLPSLPPGGGFPGGRPPFGQQ
jgi:hypothetical protein